MSWSGCYTALVTPFKNNEVDYEALKDVLEENIANGVDGVVPVGTTGESPTVDFNEHKRIISFCAEEVRGRCKVIAGTGGNATKEAVELTKDAGSDGVDATLQVTPYYNKPTQEGLYRHFSKVADEGGLPVVLYNVPGRTGKSIEYETVLRLAQKENIIAIKEAGGSTDKVSAMVNATNITVLSGDDSFTLPLMAAGGHGVISVASNIVPGQMAELVHSALDGDLKQAQRSHLNLYPLFRDLFIETNPIPIKAALAMAEKINEEYRLPLCELNPDNRKALEATLRSLNII